MIEANKIVERIGLIDLGSNTARLVIFDVLEGGYFMVADEMVEAVRLGETEIDGSLKQTRVMQAINTVKVFKKLCAVFRVDKILAVATAAVRRAKNQRTFLNEMFGSTGLKFKVVSEERTSLRRRRNARSRSFSGSSSKRSIGWTSLTLKLSL